MFKKNRLFDSIIYVNFAPYENSGKFLDYLLEKFYLVVLFSFKFHNLGKDKLHNKLIIYKNGNIIEIKKLFDYQIPEPLVFILLPFRSLYILLQILIYSLYIKYKYGAIKYYFSVNAFTSWAGLILKKFGIINKTIFWVWDYYPPIHSNLVIQYIRWLYWQFDKAAIRSDSVFFLNSRTIDLRKKRNLLPKNINYKNMPIGTEILHNANYHNKYNIRKPKKVRLIFIGVLKKIQGLDIIFDNAQDLLKNIPGIELYIVGNGPDFKYFKNQSRKTALPTKFFGYLSESELNKILSKSDVGIATYIPEPGNPAFYGDPAKIKQYLGAGLPVITTKVYKFSGEILKYNAGVIIDYKNNKSFIKGMKNISQNLPNFRNNAYKLAKKYYYKDLYPKFFN